MNLSIVRADGNTWPPEMPDANVLKEAKASLLKEVQILEPELLKKYTKVIEAADPSEIVRLKSNEPETWAEEIQVWAEIIFLKNLTRVDAHGALRTEYGVINYRLGDELFKSALAQLRTGYRRALVDTVTVDMRSHLTDLFERNGWEEQRPLIEIVSQEIYNTLMNVKKRKKKRGSI